MELMVTLVVVALLAGVVAFSTGRAAALGRQTVCSANLNRLGQAYTTFQTDTQALASLYEGSLGSSWAGHLLPYISYNGDTLVCPEAEPTNEESTPKFCKKGWGFIHWDFFNFSDPLWEQQSMSDLVPGRKPAMWKMNNEDYLAFQSKARAGWSSWPQNADHMPQYTPGEDPKEYWVVFEDAGNDWISEGAGGTDYKDYAVHIREKGSGTYEIDFYEFGSSDANHGVVAADGSEVWIAEGSGDDGGVGPFYYADPGTNYGLHADWPKSGGRLALILDYNDRLCHPDAEPDAPEAFEKNVDPRHLGRCNVLFTDGSVITMAPDEFTPRDEQLHKTFWQLPKKP
jgi:prepilin-type processing-associated H-X9-DG protein